MDSLRSETEIQRASRVDPAWGPRHKVEAAPSGGKYSSRLAPASGTAYFHPATPAGLAMRAHSRSPSQQYARQSARRHSTPNSGGDRIPPRVPLIFALDPWQWVLAALGAMLVGLAKTGIAGLGVLAVALFATILPARESVGILLVILIFTDFIAVGVYRRDASWTHLMRLFPWAAAGVVIGAAVFGLMDDRLVRATIGGILVALVALQLFRRREPDLPVENDPNRWLVAGAGLAAGFTTMIANAAGPLMVLYLLAMRLPKFTFVGTAAWFFLVLNLFKVPFSISLGLITPGTFGFSLKLVPFALLGALSGRWVISHMNQRAFEMVALLLTLLAGVRLLW